MHYAYSFSPLPPPPLPLPCLRLLLAISPPVAVVASFHDLFTVALDGWIAAIAAIAALIVLSLGT